MRGTPWLLVAAGLLLAPGQAKAAPEACPAARATDLPLPRPGKLRAAANLRQGPGMDRPILTQTEQEGAVTILAECGPWRLVRTGAGEEGWTHGAMLQARQPG